MGDKASWLVGMAVVAVMGVVCWGGDTGGQGERRVGVEVRGGHETDGRDGGRPVVLVAAGLGVPDEVFREVFKGVKPAKGRGPTEEEARRNKQVLLKGLAKYGVTNERLDEVSNYYRYRRENDELWRHEEAEIEAVVKDGKIVRIEILKGGAGYSSSPELVVPGMEGVKLKAVVGYGKDLKTNGEIKEVGLEKKGEEQR